MSSNIRTKRICEYCKTEFTGKTTKTRYCSSKCNSAAYKRTKRQSKIEQSNLEVKKEKNAAVLKNGIPIQDKQLLSIIETSIFLGVSRQTVYNWLNNGTIKGKRMSNRKVLILKSDLMSLFEQNKAYEKPTPTERKPITDFYTIEEIKNKYNIGSTWVFKIIKENNIPKTRIGGKTHISKRHIENYFNKKRDDVTHIKEWYTVKEIQGKYSLNRDQVYSRVHDNNIPRQRIGKFIKISKLHFDDLFILNV